MNLWCQIFECANTCVKYLNLNPHSMWHIGPHRIIFNPWDSLKKRGLKSSSVTVKLIQSQTVCMT